MPPTTIQRHNLHRRGQSYDMARSPIRRHNHTGSAVSMNTNVGSFQGQQILREAQQQRTARPGQQHMQPQIDGSLAQQQCGFYAQPQPFTGIPYDMSMNGIMSVPLDMNPHSQFQNMQMPVSAGSQTSFMFDENSQNYFQPMHQIPEVGQMMPQHERRMSQPDLRIQTGMRPYTPIHQIQTGMLASLPSEIILTSSSTFPSHSNFITNTATAITKCRIGTALTQMAPKRRQYRVASTCIYAEVEISPRNCRASRSAIILRRL